MEKIEFGAALPGAKGIPEFARRAESLGYDYLGAGEHMMFHGPIANTIVSLSVAAGATTRIKLMSTVVLLPLYNPTVLAKQTSVLDVASGGRYNMGIGIGGEFPKEFEACGVPVNQRGSRTNEALEVITKLWTDRQRDLRGALLQIFRRHPGAASDPKAASADLGRGPQGAGDASRGEVCRRMAAIHVHARDAAESVEKIKQFGKEAGRDMSNFRNGLFIFASIYPDREQAREQAAKALGRNYAQDFSKIAGRYTLWGNPDDCRKRLKEYVDAGARTVMISWACRNEDIDQNLELFAKEVAPAFRAS